MGPGVQTIRLPFWGVDGLKATIYIRTLSSLSGQRERSNARKRPQRHRHSCEPERQQDARVVAVRGEDGRVGEGRVLLVRVRVGVGFRV